MIIRNLQKQGVLVGYGRLIGLRSDPGFRFTSHVPPWNDGYQAVSGLRSCLAETS